YGGSPAVWNTALVFFQAGLLAGYLYAHVLSRRLSVRAQVFWHIPVLLLPVLVLPPTVAGAMAAAPGSWQAPSVFAALAASVGVPFFVLASNSSLIQHWYGVSGHSDADDPYWLYSSSNLGSFMALLAFPFLIEPLVGSTMQGTAWSWGYGIFVLLTALVAFGVYRSNPAVETNAIDPTASTSVSGADRLVWVIRSAVGVSLLLSVTMEITTDVASVPLLWIIPLALYLLTFVLAFARSFRIPRSPVVATVVLGISASLGLTLVPGIWPLWLVLTVALGTLFFGALLCHLDLARDRPSVHHLTEFYLWIACGGVVGGILNSIVAPLVFDSVAEYPITLAVLALLLVIEPGPEGGIRGVRLARPLAMAAMIALILPAQSVLRESNLGPALVWIAPVAVALVTGLLISLKEGLFAVVVAVVAVQVVSGVLTGNVDAQERSFFGVTRVASTAEYRIMTHGTTIHGAQPVDPTLRSLPVTYYDPAGPLGAVVGAASDGARIGVLGLGVGSLAAYGKPGQRITFHEIDPNVVRLARSHFTYLSDSRASISVVPGDGRLTLADVPDRTYDLLVMDAFSSDAIPVHLLTVEALEIYLRKVKNDGLILLHITNRHLELQRVFRGFSDRTGRPVAIAEYDPDDDAKDRFAEASRVVAIAPSSGAIEALVDLPAWSALDEDLPSVLWTDQFSSILPVIR
ncbi:MAG: spermidine synthase, partial [Gemmatimonadota bacterium]